MPEPKGDASHKSSSCEPVICKTCRDEKDDLVNRIRMKRDEPLPKLSEPLESYDEEEDLMEIFIAVGPFELEDAPPMKC